MTTVPADDWMTPVMRVPKMTPLMVDEVTHDRHTIQEQRNTAQQRGDVCNVHKTMLLKSSYCSIAQDGRASLSIRKMPSFLL